MVNNLRLSASSSTRIGSKAMAGQSSTISRVRNTPNMFNVPGFSQKSSGIAMGSMRTNKSAISSKIVSSRPKKSSQRSGIPTNYSTKVKENANPIVSGAATLKSTYLADNANFLRSAAKLSFPVPPPQQQRTLQEI